MVGKYLRLGNGIQDNELFVSRCGLDKKFVQFNIAGDENELYAYIPVDQLEELRDYLNEIIDEESEE